MVAQVNLERARSTCTNLDHSSIEITTRTVTIITRIFSMVSNIQTDRPTTRFPPALKHGCQKVAMKPSDSPIPTMCISSSTDAKHRSHLSRRKDLTS
jgi:hypothetical protein